MPRERSRSPERSSHRHERSHGSSSRHARDDDRERDYHRDRDARSSKHESSSHSHRRDRERDRDSHRDSHRRRSRSRSRERRDDAESSRRRDKDRARSRDSSDDEEERKRRKRERKAAKRAHREEEEASAQRAVAAEALMYAADANPFNDADLGSRFKWGKKEEKEKKQGISRVEAERRDAERRREAQEEIIRLNQKRAEREIEQAQREEEEARMARLAESAAMSEWVAREDDFHLEQSRKRSAIRVRENRAKPIDLLEINLKWTTPRDSTKEGEEMEEEEAGLEIDLDEPYVILENLTLEETEELHQDIQMYLQLEKDERHLDFWRSMIVVCDDKLDELRLAAEQRSGAMPSTASRIDPTVKAEMDNMLSSKTHAQLVVLQDQVRNKLRSGEMIDVEYWEGLLKNIVVWRAKAKLRDAHELVLANRIDYLRQKQRRDAERMQDELLAQMEDDQAMRAEERAGRGDADGAQGAEASSSFESEWDSSMEPRTFLQQNLPYEERQLEIVDPEEDRAALIVARRRIMQATFVPRARRQVARPADAEVKGEDLELQLWKEEAAADMDVEEEVFDAAEELMETNYKWEDKYRPRKPRYFNRVHTGYEWSRYNQTHYDSVENPPPKVVQGYKFNIFYPDLIDKTKAPSYRVKKDPDDPDTALIIFTAGPPYEDIGFRIVNKPWNQSHRRGFRASFDRGVMQLYFNFQRTFYRK